MCEPLSTTAPWLMTRMRSQCRTVDRRCATDTAVRPAATCVLGWRRPQHALSQPASSATRVSMGGSQPAAQPKLESGSGFGFGSIPESRAKAGWELRPWERSGIAACLAQGSQDASLGGRVQRTGGLVAQQQPRRAQHRTRNGHALLLTARQLHAALANGGVQTRGQQPQRGVELCGAGGRLNLRGWQRSLVRCHYRWLLLTQAGSAGGGGRAGGSRAVWRPCGTW